MWIRKKELLIISLFITIFISSCLIIVFKFNNNNKVKTECPTSTERVVHLNGSIAHENMEDLILDSNVIVKGKVNMILPDRKRFPDKGKNSIDDVLHTDVLVSIDRIFKGTPYNSKNILVRLNKGSTDTEVVAFEGYPDFVYGEDVILFLSKDDCPSDNLKEDYYVLTGMRQGKFTVDKGDTSKNVYVMDFIYREEKIYLNTFESEIRNTLEKEKINPRKTLTKEEIKENNKKYFGE